MLIAELHVSWCIIGACRPFTFHFNGWVSELAVWIEDTTIKLSRNVVLLIYKAPFQPIFDF